MNGLIPLMAALVIVEAAVHGASTTSSGRWIPGLAATGIAFAVILLVGEIAARIIRRKHLRGRWAESWDTAAQTLALGLFAGIAWPGSWTGGWALLTTSYTVAILPWLALQVGHWWTFALITGWQRRDYVLHQVRFGLLPVLAALPVMDLCDQFARMTGYGHWLNTHLGLAANAAGSFLMAILLVALLPALLVRLWGARPLPPGELQADLAAACGRFGVPVAGILIWPGEGGRVTNALVLGLVTRLRWILITPDLLHEFPRSQLHAVLGHELGHVRHHHLWLYLLFAACTGMLSWWLKDPLVDLASQHLPWALDREILRVVVGLTLLALLWRLVFGALSRACERQADLAGMELAGDSGAMPAALLAVARQQGGDPDAPSWRHGPISRRAAFLAAAVADPALAAHHHRLIRRWTIGLIAAAGALAILLLTTRHDLLPG